MKAGSFSYKRVIKRRDILFNRVMRPYWGLHLTCATLDDFIDDVLAELPANVSRDAVFESIRVYAGIELSRRNSFEIAWRLAGNVDKLVRGFPALPWTAQLEDEIVPVRVEYMRPHKKFDSPGYMLYCRAVAGSSCPMLFSNFFSRRSCSGIAASIGFSAPWGLYPFKDPMYFVNLLFLAHVEAEKSHSKPVFTTVSCTSGLRLENKAKIEVRTRARPCPRGFTHQCNHCPIGYSDCPAGIYPKTLVTRMCTQCNKDSFFEPDDAGHVCVNCRYFYSTAQKV